MGSLPLWLEELKEADPDGYADLQRYFQKQDDERVTKQLSQTVPSSSFQAPETTSQMTSTANIASFHTGQSVSGHPFHRQGMSWEGVDFRSKQYPEHSG
jgi:hypothetical protein